VAASGCGNGVLPKPMNTGGEPELRNSDSSAGGAHPGTSSRNQYPVTWIQSPQSGRLGATAGLYAPKSGTVLRFLAFSGAVKESGGSPRIFPRAAFVLRRSLLQIAKWKAACRKAFKPPCTTVPRFFRPSQS
jgi:hypothetical protein